MWLLYSFTISDASQSLGITSQERDLSAEELGSEEGQWARHCTSCFTPGITFNCPPLATRLHHFPRFIDKGNKAPSC